MGRFNSRNPESFSIFFRRNAGITKCFFSELTLLRSLRSLRTSLRSLRSLARVRSRLRCSRLLRSSLPVASLRSRSSSSLRLRYSLGSLPPSFRFATLRAPFACFGGCSFHPSTVSFARLRSLRSLRSLTART